MCVCVGSSRISHLKASEGVRFGNDVYCHLRQKHIYSLRFFAAAAVAASSLSKSNITCHTINFTWLHYSLHTYICIHWFVFEAHFVRASDCVPVIDNVGSDQLFSMIVQFFSVSPLLLHFSYSLFAFFPFAIHIFYFRGRSVDAPHHASDSIDTNSCVARTESERLNVERLRYSAKITCPTPLYN